MQPLLNRPKRCTEKAPFAGTMGNICGSHQQQNPVRIREYILSTDTRSISNEDEILLLKL